MLACLLGGAIYCGMITAQVPPPQPAWKCPDNLVNNGGFAWMKLPDFWIPVGENGSNEPPGFTGGWVDRVDLATGNVKRLYDSCDGERFVGPNDIVFDDHGGFWFTDFGKVRTRTMDRGSLLFVLAGGGRRDMPSFKDSGEATYQGEVFAGSDRVDIACDRFVSPFRVAEAVAETEQRLGPPPVVAAITDQQAFGVDEIACLRMCTQNR